MLQECQVGTLKPIKWNYCPQVSVMYFAMKKKIFACGILVILQMTI